MLWRMDPRRPSWALCTRRQTLESTAWRSSLTTFAGKEMNETRKKERKEREKERKKRYERSYTSRKREKEKQRSLALSLCVKGDKRKRKRATGYILTTQTRKTWNSICLLFFLSFFLQPTTNNISSTLLCSGRCLKKSKALRARGCQWCAPTRWTTMASSWTR